jgi:hypothetical protein
VPTLSAADMDLIAGEIAKARNAVAAMSFDDLAVDDADEPAVPPAPTFEEPTDGTPQDHSRLIQAASNQ